MQDGKYNKRIEEMTLDEQIWHLEHPGQPYVPPQSNTIYASPEYGASPDMKMDREASENLYQPAEQNTAGGIYRTPQNGGGTVYQVPAQEKVDAGELATPEEKAATAVYEVVDHHTEEDVSVPEEKAATAVYEVVDHHTEEDVSVPEEKAATAVYEVVDHHTEEDVSVPEEKAVTSIYGAVDLEAQKAVGTKAQQQSAQPAGNRVGIGEPPIPPYTNGPIGGEIPPEPSAPQFESGSSTAVKVITAIVFLSLIALSIFAALFLSKKFMVAQKGDQQYDAGSDDPWADILGGDDKDKDEEDKDDKGQSEKEKKKKEEKKKEDKKKDQEEESSKGSGKDETIEDYDFGKDREEQSEDEKASDDQASEEQSSDAESADDEEIDPFFEDTGTLYQNHSASEFEGKEYYEEFVDCIDESLSYKVKRKYAKKLDLEERIGITTSYVQLSGDIPNLDEINEQLASYGEYYINYYMENENEIREYLKYYGNMSCLAKTVCHVTYTDEDMISVIFEDQTDVLGTKGVYVTSVNINLKTGTILDNGQILDLPDDFGKTFRERSLKQNGETPGTDLFSDEQIMTLLDDTSSLIVFYTPVGLEIGYEYQKGQNNGWLTISLREYQQYLKGL